MRRPALILALATAAPTAAADACRPAPRYEQWLDRQAPVWDRTLGRYPGYERPEDYRVCLVERGNSRTDPARGRILLRPVNELQDRLSLAHEYLHLAFRHHPKTLDETFIETTARRLVLGDSP